jgi:nitrite reductase/ring-hydroxylating ferredoxin subunit
MRTTDHRECPTDNRATGDGELYCIRHQRYFDGATGKTPEDAGKDPTDNRATDDT